MKFDELDKKMRVFETAHDYCVPPGIFIVTRLDGRNFTRLTKELHDFVAPYDERFRDLMVDTAAHLMECGFRVTYAYTESDEISLLLHPSDITFGRKTRSISAQSTFTAINQRTILIPPPVEPADAPTNIRITRTIFARLGQRLKSSVQNPVVVWIETV